MKKSKSYHFAECLIGANKPKNEKKKANYEKSHVNDCAGM